MGNEVTCSAVRNSFEMILFLQKQQTIILL